MLSHLFTLIEEDFNKTKNLMKATEEGGDIVENINQVRSFISNSTETLNRWYKQLGELKAVKTISLISKPQNQ